MSKTHTATRVRNFSSLQPVLPLVHLVKFPSQQLFLPHFLYRNFQQLVIVNPRRNIIRYFYYSLLFSLFNYYTRDVFLKQHYGRITILTYSYINVIWNFRKEEIPFASVQPSTPVDHCLSDFRWTGDVAVVDETKLRLSRIRGMRWV